MALRTRIFAAVIKRISTPVEEVDDADFSAFRAKRVKLQSTALGRLAFGKADPAALIEDRIVDLDGTSVRLRICRPKTTPGALPAVINFHGGGWVQGNPEQSEWAASRIATRVGVVVVSVAYRLAPSTRSPRLSTTVGQPRAGSTTIRPNSASTPIGSR